MVSIKGEVEAMGSIKEEAMDTFKEEVEGQVVAEDHHQNTRIAQIIIVVTISLTH